MRRPTLATLCPVAGVEPGPVGFQDRAGGAAVGLKAPSRTALVCPQARGKWTSSPCCALCREGRCFGGPQEAGLDTGHAALLMGDGFPPSFWFQSNGNQRDLNVREAWQQGYTGRGIVVSILDDGIEKNHPDLEANYVSRGRVLCRGPWEPQCMLGAVSCPFPRGGVCGWVEGLPSTQPLPVQSGPRLPSAEGTTLQKRA